MKTQMSTHSLFFILFQNLRTVGYVGDRVILMEKNGFYGKPSIEIVQGIGTLKPPRSDLILYTDKIP